MLFKTCFLTGCFEFAQVHAPTHFHWQRGRRLGAERCWAPPLRPQLTERQSPLLGMASEGGTHMGTGSASSFGMMCALVPGEFPQESEVAGMRQWPPLPWRLEKFHMTLNEKTLFGQRKGLPLCVVECIYVCVYSVVCVCVCGIYRHTQWDTTYQTFIHSSVDGY